MLKIFVAPSFAVSLAVALIASAPLVASAPLKAQSVGPVVGHRPAESPFHDVKPSQHITVFGGYFDTPQDEIGATPRGGALIGLRYDLPVSGPAEFFVRAQRVSSHRTAFDPSLPAATHSLGDQSVQLYIADLGFALNLTGQKSWHSLIPVIGLGAGIATASRSSGGKDPYNFGTQFAITADAGLRIVPGNSYEIRLMAGNVLYQNHYPTAYYAAPVAGADPLLSANTARSGYRANWTYTAGLAVPLFR
ncbi:MAG: hypothetical protein ACR2M1_07930 [Gemmatimonadaceae bacterium]